MLNRFYEKPVRTPQGWDDFYDLNQMDKLNKITPYMNDTTLSPDIFAFFKAEIFNRNHWDVTRNNMANALIWAKDQDGNHPDPALHEAFITMLEDEDEDPVWRDYCLQFISENLPNSNNPKLVTSMLKKYAKGSDNKAGTAIIHLAFQEQYGKLELDDNFNQQLTKQLADPKVTQATKMSIIAVIGKRKDITLLPIIRQYAKQDNNAGLKRVAIAALGIIANSAETQNSITAEDKAIIQTALNHKSRAVQLAAKAAWQKIITNPSKPE